MWLPRIAQLSCSRPRGNGFIIENISIFVKNCEMVLRLSLWENKTAIGHIALFFIQKKRKIAIVCGHLLSKSI